MQYAVSGLLAHPLYGVGLLAIFALGIGVSLAPRIHDVITHGHPRC